MADDWTQGTFEILYQGAFNWQDYNDKIADLVQSFDNTLEDDQRQEELAANALMEADQQSSATAAAWAATNQANAQHDWDVAMDAAGHDYHQASIDAGQELADGLALAAKNRAYAVADAETTLAKSREDAALAATAAWAAAEGTPWSQYLANLETNEDQYIHDSMDARDQLLRDEADADYAKAQALDAATHDQQQVLGDRGQSQSDDLSQSSTDLAIDLAQADESRLLQTDISAAKDEADKYVNYEGDYLLKEIAAQHDWSYAWAKAGRISGTEGAFLFASGIPTNVPAYSADEEAILTEWTHSIAQANDDLTHACTAASETLESEQLPNEVAYDINVRGAMASEITTLAGQRQGNQSGVAQTEHDYSVPVATAQEDLSKAQAAADEGHVIALAAADRDYSDKLALYQQNQAVSDAEADQTFENAEASGYAAQMQAWAQSVNTPWATYQAALASASATNTAATTAANVAHAQALWQPNINQADAVDAAVETQADDDAAAALASVDTIVDDQENQVQPVADAQLQNSNQIVTATANAQTADAAVWAADADTAEQDYETYQHALNVDGWAETNTAADLYLTYQLARDWAHDNPVAAAQYATDLDAAKAQQATDDATAATQWQTDLAGVSAAWQTAAGNQATTFNSQVSAADQTLSATTSSAESGISADALSADETLAEAEANDQAAESVAADQADFTLGEAASAADDTLGHANTVADENLQGAVALADADYRVNLADEFSTALAAAAAASGTPLAEYQSQIAASLAALAVSDRAALVSEQALQMPADIQLADDQQAADDAEAHADRQAELDDETKIADAEAAATVATAEAEAEDASTGGTDENTLATGLATAANDLAVAQQQADDLMAHLEWQNGSERFN